MTYSVPFLGLKSMEIKDLTAEVKCYWSKELPEVRVQVDFTNNLVQVFEVQEGPILPRLKASYKLECHES